MRKAFWTFILYAYVILVLIIAAILFCFKPLEWVVKGIKNIAIELYISLDKADKYFKNKINRA